jgi:hypothetical protein
MTVTRYPRPCPIPGHPQDDAPAPLASGSTWSRLRAWHLHAPAERLPLPLTALTWPLTWVLHAVHVPGHVVTYAAAGAVAITWLRWRRHARTPPHPRLAATEAATVAAAIGGWAAAAVTSGPLGWPAHLLSWIYLAGAVCGYRWLRRHPAVLAARTRRDEHAAWTARKADWHRIAHLIGLGDFHLQSATPTRLGEELVLTSAPGSELATRVAANSRPYAEKYAHLRGLPYGRVGIRTTDYPGQLIIEVREKDPSVNGPVTHPALDPDSPYKDWFPDRRSIRTPIPIGVVPETGEPMELVLWDQEGGKAVGVYSMTGGGKTNMLDDIREWVTACDDEPPEYVTIEALAQAVHEGLVEANQEQRAVLQQAWQIARRPHLTLVPPLPDNEKGLRTVTGFASQMRPAVRPRCVPAASRRLFSEVPWDARDAPRARPLPDDIL